MEESFWKPIREQFPITQDFAYFQSAGMSPMPDCVLNAVTESYTKVNRYGDMYWMEELEKSNKLRSKLAALVNTHAENITIAHNTSTAFSFLASALKAGSSGEFNLISLMDEFPSTHIPFEFQGIPVKFVQPENSIYSVDMIMEAVDQNTLGVVCSFVQYSTGFRLNIEELGRRLSEKGLLFLLNATQGFPTFEIDVQKMHIDAMTVSFHKWGCCAHAGSLFYTSQALREKYPNPQAGWLSVKPSPNDFIPAEKNVGYTQHKDAGQYNFGTINFQALSGLHAAIDFMQQTGMTHIRNRILQIVQYLIEKLEVLPLTIVSPIQRVECRSGIVLIDLKDKNNASCVEFLKERKIVTSIRAGKIRISCNFFNNHQDVDRLTAALQQYLAS